MWRRRYLWAPLGSIASPARMDCGASLGLGGGGRWTRRGWYDLGAWYRAGECCWIAFHCPSKESGNGGNSSACCGRSRRQCWWRPFDGLIGAWRDSILGRAGSCAGGARSERRGVDRLGAFYMQERQSNAWRTGVTLGCYQCVWGEEDEAATWDDSVPCVSAC